MGDIEKRNENLPQNTAGNDNAALPAKLRDSISGALSKITDKKTSVALASLVRHVEFASDVKAHLSRETILRAYIPKHLEEAWKAGDLKFMVKKDTGEQLGALVGKDSILNKGFVRIEEGYMPDPNLLHSLSGVAMQQQLAHMAAVLDDVRSRVIALQEAQDQRLLGKLRGMRAQLIQMRDATDPENRRGLALNAITVLNATRGEITQRLIGEMRKIPVAPENLIAALAKAFFSKDFRPNLVEGYDKIQELFGYYLAATQMLAYSYAFLDEERSYAAVFVPEPELMDKKALDKLIRAEIVVGDHDALWYKEPEEFLGRIKREAKRLFKADGDYIEVEFTGAQLLEALEDGRQEIEEQREEEGQTGSLRKGR